METSEVEPEIDIEQRKLLEKQDSRLVSQFDAFSLERDARKNWDKFYMRNSTNFFKDRHWTEREFAELDADNRKYWPEQKYTILESGCGVGNFIFPILKEYSSVRAFACDFSIRAVNFVNSRAKKDGFDDRLTAFQVRGYAYAII